jgi:hypothetical protein
MVYLQTTRVELTNSTIDCDYQYPPFFLNCTIDSEVGEIIFGVDSTIDSDNFLIFSLAIIVIIVYYRLYYRLLCDIC